MSDTPYQLDLMIDERKIRARANNRKRQERHRQKLLATGLQQITGYVHSHQAAKLALLIEALRHNPDLECGPAIDSVTRRFTKYD